VPLLAHAAHADNVARLAETREGAEVEHIATRTQRGARSGQQLQRRVAAPSREAARGRPHPPES